MRLAQNSKKMTLSDENMALFLLAIFKKNYVSIFLFHPEFFVLYIRLRTHPFPQIIQKCNKNGFCGGRFVIKPHYRISFMKTIIGLIIVNVYDNGVNDKFAQSSD